MNKLYIAILVLIAASSLPILPAQAAKIIVGRDTCLHSRGNMNTVGTPVTFSTCNVLPNTPAEVEVNWVISDGTISLSKCIGFADGNPVAGAPAVMVTCGHDRVGPWTFMNNGYIKYEPSGLCLTASIPSNAAFLRPCGSDDANQDFYIR